MANIIVPNNYDRTDAAKEYREFWAWIYPHLVKTLEGSFIDQHSMHPTQAMVKERRDYCVDTINTLRRDKKWSKFKIRDLLPEILRTKLAGGQVDLDKWDKGGRTSWITPA